MRFHPHQIILFSESEYTNSGRKLIKYYNYNLYVYYLLITKQLNNSYVYAMMIGLALLTQQH